MLIRKVKLLADQRAKYHSHVRFIPKVHSCGCRSRMVSYCNTLCGGHGPDMGILTSHQGSHASVDELKHLFDSVQIVYEVLLTASDVAVAPRGQLLKLTSCAMASMIACRRTLHMVNSCVGAACASRSCSCTGPSGGWCIAAGAMQAGLAFTCCHSLAVCSCHADSCSSCLWRCCCHLVLRLTVVPG